MYILEFGIYNFLLLVSLFLAIRTKKFGVFIIFMLPALFLSINNLMIVNDQNLTWEFRGNASGTNIIYPDHIEVDRGTYENGDVTKLQAKDNDYFNLTELGETPGAVVHIHFNNVVGEPHEIKSYVDYDGNHDVYFRVFNDCKNRAGFLASPWDDKFNIDSGGFWYNMSLPQGDCYLDENRHLEVQIYHAVAGVASHDIMIDYLELETQLEVPEINPEYIIYFYIAVLVFVLMLLGYKISDLISGSMQ